MQHSSGSVALQVATQPKGAALHNAARNAMQFNAAHIAAQVAMQIAALHNAAQRSAAQLSSAQIAAQHDTAQCSAGQAVAQHSAAKRMPIVLWCDAAQHCAGLHC